MAKIYDNIKKTYINVSTKVRYKYKILNPEVFSDYPIIKNDDEKIEEKVITKKPKVKKDK